MENKIINEYEIDNERRVKELRARRIAAIALALTAGGSALTACSNTQTVKNETTEDKKQESILEETTAEIDKIYEEVNQKNINEVLYRLLTPNYKESEVKILDVDMSKATKEQEEFLNRLYGTITKYHELTHKENNFRLDADGDNYLDLRIDEILSFDLVQNNYTTEELSELLGNASFTKEYLTTNLDNIYFNFMIYYMTATEKSVISDLIKDENKKALFERIEEKALNLNRDYSEENLQDFLSEEMVDIVFNLDEEALEKMDFETFLSTIPIVAVAQRRFSDNFELMDSRKNLIKIFENIIDEKITKLERVSPDIQKEYSEQSSKSNKIIAKDKENSIKNLKKEAKEKFKNAYGTDLKEYMSEEDLDEYITNYYENEVYTTNFGVPLSFVFNNVNYDLLEGKYAYSDSMDEEDDVLPLYKIRLELLQRELGKISYNDIDQEQKESVQEKEKVKVRTLKRKI